MCCKARPFASGTHAAFPIRNRALHSASVGQALYGEALEALPDAAAQQRATVHANAAAAHLKLAQWAEAAKATSAALEAVPGHEKALLRRAAAYEELADLERALADYEAVRPRFFVQN